MNTAPTRVALGWFERQAARRDQATHAVWYTTGSGSALALVEGKRTAQEVYGLYSAREALEAGRDADVLMREIDRKVISHEVLRAGWPRPRGGEVYEIPDGPVVRIVNRRVIRG